LGGDSLLASQIINRIRDVLQVELSFLFFFQQPTIANVAIEMIKVNAKQTEDDALAEILADLETLSEEEALKVLSNLKNSPAIDR
jgi:hypothetical protein